MTNVMGDSLGAGIVNHFSVDEMPPMDHEMHDPGASDKHPNHQLDTTTSV